MGDFFASRFGASGFLNEHLWLGHLGHFFLVLSFIASLLATVAYAFAEYNKGQKSWLRLARTAFIAHGLSVLGVFVLLFIMILNHWFEYHYAWRHSSTTLPMEYIISSFWEGQEGSFLLWQFWLVVLGFVGIRILKDWEQPVMGVVSLTQFFLGSMVLGIYIFGYKIGSNPFVLLRDEMANAPIFQRPEYLQFIADGNGLNPLLQNYWMTIHPPVLFLGFASVSIPFAFAVGALIRNDYTTWVKPALSWSLFCVAILGTGILMGGAWAYESLSFGGFWAWDPVENMSFVPWLLVVAGIHTHLVYKHTGHSLTTTLLFYIFGFGMVLYSTFLTRSGILGDTSVHAFTDLGMTGQLLIYLGALVLPPLLLLVARYRSLPSIKTEEELFSREFWMFIGALVLLLSAVQMTFTTSIPVWNKLFGMKLAPPENVVRHYNDIQIWIAVIAAILTASIQFLSYKSGRLSPMAKFAAYSFGISVLAAIGLAYAFKIDFTEQYVIDFTKAKVLSSVFFKFKFIGRDFLLLLTAVYTVLGNLAYMIFVVKGRINVSGAAIAHFGFGLFLIGVLISQGKKEVISINQAGIDFGKDFKSNEKIENVLLLKDSALAMGDYSVSYKGLQVEGVNNYYLVNYVRKNKTGAVQEEFQLKPNAQINPKMGLIANPDTKHYITKDVFTHVSSVPNNEELKDTSTMHEIAVGDTFFNLSSFTIFKQINRKPDMPIGYDATGKLLIAAVLETKTMDGKTYTNQPVYVVDQVEGKVSGIPSEEKSIGITYEIAQIKPEAEKFVIAVREKETPVDFIIMKAIVFPYINLVWLGGILTFGGTFLSMYRRRKEAVKEIA